MPDSLLRRVASGVVWSYAALLGGRLVVFAGLALSARVLSPAEFGEFAMAMTVVSFLEVVRGFGLQRALIYFGGRSEAPRVLGTGCILSVGIALLLALALAASSELISQYYGVATVREYLRALGVYIVIGAVGLVPDAVLRNRLDFRQRFVPETAAPVVRYALAVAYALQGYGAWSLVIGQIGGATVGVLLTLLAARWLPSMEFDVPTAKQLLAFGGQMNIVDLSAAVTLNADYLFVGRFLGSDALGIYTLAFRLPDTTIVAVAFAVAQLLLPTYVKLGADPAMLRSGFLETTRYLSMVLLPAAVGIVILAPSLVEALFGSRWLDAAPLVQLLAVSALIRALAFSPGAIFVAAGRPGLSVAAEVTGAVVSVALFYIAAQQSVWLVAAVQLVSAGVYAAAKFWLLRLVVNVDGVLVMRSLGPTVLATAGMALTLLTLQATREPLGPVLHVAVGVAGGVLAYGIVLWNFDGAAIRRALQLVRPSATLPSGVSS